MVLPAFMMSRAQCVAAGDSLEPALPNGYPGATPDLLEFEPDKERRRPTWFTPLDCEHCAILHLHYVSCRVVLDTILGPGFMERAPRTASNCLSGHQCIFSPVSDHTPTIRTLSTQQRRRDRDRTTMTDRCPCDEDSCQRLGPSDEPEREGRSRFHRWAALALWP